MTLIEALQTKQKMNNIIIDYEKNIIEKLLEKIYDMKISKKSSYYKKSFWIDHISLCSTTSCSKRDVTALSIWSSNSDCTYLGGPENEPLLHIEVRGENLNYDEPESYDYYLPQIWFKTDKIDINSLYEDWKKRLINIKKNNEWIKAKINHIIELERLERLKLEKQQEAEKQQRIEQQEYAEYLRLKAKYEGE